ncbi:MAG TPA: hypothetical protein VIO58_13115 [Candidatus Methanoperedens sp.]
MVNRDIYSELVAEIKQDVEKIVKGKMDICTLLKKFTSVSSRNFIQKYVETELNDYNSKLGKISYVVALFAVVLTPLQSLMSIYYPQFYEQHKQVTLIFILVFAIAIVFLFLWIVKIPNEKNILKNIIMAIEEDKLKGEEVKSITQKSEFIENVLNTKVEKKDSNSSILEGR